MCCNIRIILLMLWLAFCNCYPSNTISASDDCVRINDCEDVVYVATKLGNFDSVNFCNKTTYTVHCPEKQKTIVPEYKNHCLKYAKMDGICPTELLIRNSSVAAENEYPFMALVEVKNKTSNFTVVCGGTLIDQMYVLTAAHCFDMRRNQLGFQISVRLGAHERISSGTQYYATEIVHPDYSGDTADISLLKLSKPANITNKVKPACLSESPSSANKEYQVAGWGFVKPNELADTLRSGKLVSVEIKHCAKPEEELKGDQFICTKPKQNYGDVCPNDSGSPLFTPLSEYTNCLFEIFGVVSRGDKCHLNNSFTRHTRVFYYRDWIENTVWLKK